jgi:TonB-linked SusC/RagA family outer membrane protein
MTTNGLGNNTANLFSRGHSRNGSNQLVTIVDGMERDINMMLLEEIESIHLMKDATSKILYGSRAANGVLSITTKQGKMHTRKITATYQQGLGFPNKYPTYLNSYEYALMHNEARENDGLTPIYTPADLEGYKNSKGAFDMRYPDVDYLDYFLKKTSGFNKATVEFSGGNENAQYAFVAGYNGNTGLQKIGETPTRDWFNIRGNLTMKITDFINAYVGIAGIFDINKRAVLNHSGTFDRIRDIRPNEFPLIIDPIYLPVDTFGHYGIGVSFDKSGDNDNLYNALKYRGSYRDNAVNGQLNFGVNFDLSMITKGLSAKAQLSFDNFFYGEERLQHDVAKYALRWNYDPELGEEALTLVQLGTTTQRTQKVLLDSYNLRGTSYLLGFDYERTFNNMHRFSGNMFYNYMIVEESSNLDIGTFGAGGSNTNNGINPDLQNSNAAFRLNYAYQDKYIVEGSVALMGSDKFPKDNRYFWAYAGGLGWVISEENFLKGNAAIDYLKVKASAGLLGYDRATDYNLYFNRWADNGNNYQVAQGWNLNRVQLMNWASTGLKWEKAQEVSAGFEGLFLNRRLWVESNYFYEMRSDIITDAGSYYSNVYGSLFGQRNLQKVRNQGIEFEFRYMSKVGEVFYSVGLNGLYSKSVLIKTNEVEHPWENRRNTGQSTDNTLGYVALGLFGKDVPLDENTPIQTLGYYQEGDIAYKDLNGDGIIDENDRKTIGNSFPRVNLGLPVDLSWNGFGLNLLCVASLGIKDVVTNEYFWNYGNNKWSDMALDRYHKFNNPTGTYPRLTTTEGDNNFVNSTFWLHNRDFFRLKNAEVSYTFGHNKPITPWLKTAKIFLRGTNVLTISKFKALDPEIPNAGVNNYPLFSVYSVGASLTF